MGLKIEKADGDNEKQQNRMKLRLKETFPTDEKKTLGTCWGGVSVRLIIHNLLTKTEFIHTLLIEEIN